MTALLLQVIYGPLYFFVNNKAYNISNAYKSLVQIKRQKPSNLPAGRPAPMLHNVSTTTTRRRQLPTNDFQLHWTLLKLYLFS